MCSCMYDGEYVYVTVAVTVGRYVRSVTEGIRAGVCACGYVYSSV